MRGGGAFSGKYTVNTPGLKEKYLKNGVARTDLSAQ